MALTVTTINVNGIRAAVRKGFQDWLTAAAPDVVTLQEVRASGDQFAALVDDGWHRVHDEGLQAGRAGVAVLSRHPIVAARHGLDDPAAGGPGRWTEADLDTADGRGLTVVSTYCHTGEATDPDRMAEKHAFLTDGRRRLVALAAAGRHVVWTGDLNVAHHEWDIKNWKGNRGKAGFLVEERAHLDRLLHDDGWTDVVRQLAGDGPGPYTWWSYRGRAYDNDSGWRIDHQFATPDLAATAKDLLIDRSMSYADRWSDHAPVSVTYGLPLADPVP